MKRERRTTAEQDNLYKRANVYLEEKQKIVEGLINDMADLNSGSATIYIADLLRDITHTEKINTTGIKTIGGFSITTYVHVYTVIFEIILSAHKVDWVTETDPEKVAKLADMISESIGLKHNKIREDIEAMQFDYSFRATKSEILTETQNYPTVPA